MSPDTAAHQPYQMRISALIDADTKPSPVAADDVASPRAVDADTLAAALALSDLQRRGSTGSTGSTAVGSPASLAPASPSGPPYPSIHSMYGPGGSNGGFMPPPIHLATPDNPNIFLSRVQQSIPLARPVLSYYSSTIHANSIVGRGARVVDTGVRQVIERVDKGMGEGRIEGVLNGSLDWMERRGVIRASSGAATANADNDVKDIVSLDNANHAQTSLSAFQRAIVTTTSITSSGWAALSDDARKSLKFCLEWLTWAVRRVHAHLQLLRRITSHFNPETGATAAAAHYQSSSELTIATPEDPEKTHRALAEIAAQVVDTLRRAVHVLSQHAGRTLPTKESRDRVRSFVLALPQRWSAVMSAQADSNARSLLVVPGGLSTTLAANQEWAHQLTVLANETLVTLTGVKEVIHGTLERAEGWNQKLGWVGLGSTAGASSVDAVDADGDASMPQEAAEVALPDTPMDED